MLVKTALQFTRDGAQLVVRSKTGVQLVDAAGGPPRVLAGGPVADVAVVGDEIWIVDGDPLVLRRIGPRGDAIETRPLWGSAGDGGRLMPVALGGAAALWTSEPAAIVRASE